MTSFVDLKVTSRIKNNRQENKTMNHPLNILYEDNQILVCEKPSGIAVQSRRIGTADMESLLKNHIFREGNGQRPFFIM